MRAGKQVGTHYYVHKDYVPEKFKSAVATTLQEVPEDFPYVIVKIDILSGAISFIESEDFDTANEPSVGRSLKISPTATTKLTRPRGQIYHHKWLLVGDDYQGFDVQASKQRSKEWNDLATPADRRRIGYRSYWLDFLNKHNLSE